MISLHYILSCDVTIALSNRKSRSKHSITMSMIVNSLDGCTYFCTVSTVSNGAGRNLFYSDRQTDRSFIVSMCLWFFCEGCCDYACCDRRDDWNVTDEIRPGEHAAGTILLVVMS